LEQAIPWSVIKRDPVTGQEMRDEEGKEIWEGYCIDFIKELSKHMQFDYDLVIPDDQEFGKRLPNGEWSGLIGDLVKGVGSSGLFLYLYTLHTYILYFIYFTY